MTGFPEFPKGGHAFSADEAGTAFAGLIRRDAAGMPVPGMLAAPKITAVAAAWKVQVGPFAYARRIAAAVGFSGLSAADQVDIVSSATIPAGQARIDRVCWNAVDSSLVVIAGTPATSPVPPADGGLVRVLLVRVNAGDGSVIQGQITPEFEKTGLAGESQDVWGMISRRSVVAGGATYVDVAFPPGSFTSPPLVMISQLEGSRDTGVSVESITKDGFRAMLGSMSVVSRQVGATWQARAA